MRNVRGALWVVGMACGVACSSESERVQGPGVTGPRTDTGPSHAPSGAGPSEDDGNGETIVDEGVLPSGSGPSEPGACERQVEMAVVPLSPPPPFDVVIVADHSESLTWSRDDLAKGLADLMDQVHGANVRFFVLTPTQYGEHSQAVSLMGGDLVEWRDPKSGLPYKNDVTVYSEVCTDLQGSPIECPSYPPPSDIEFQLEGTFSLRMPAPVAAITEDMTLAELEAEQTAVIDGILALGLGGAAYEQPMCTLLRYVNQPPAELPERAVFIVISDEDDATSPMDCLTGVTYEQHFEPALVGGCTADCDVRRYTMYAEYAQITRAFTCMPYDDFGSPLPDGAHPITTYYNPVVDCSDVAVGACSVEEATEIQGFCNAGERVEDCVKACAPSDFPRPCIVDVEDVNGDACNQAFVSGGQEYANVADYCEQVHQLGGFTGCTAEDFELVPSTDITSLTGSQCPLTFVAGTDPLALAAAFSSQAEQVFGNGKYFVEVIGLMPGFACPLGAGQSHASNLATLASSPADVFPICDSYAPALSRVRSYATGSLRTEYPLAISELETVEAVYVTDLLGAERELASDAYTHDFSLSTLRLEAGVLTNRDRTLRVELQVHCTRPLR